MTRGKGLLISSGATSAQELRSWRDVAALLAVAGASPRQTAAVLGRNARWGNDLRVVGDPPWV